jgi:electron transfer flavoprotein alpha subunit
VLQAAVEDASPWMKGGLEEQMIGGGKTIRPKLYIGSAFRGHQHVVGSDAQRSSPSTDPNAAIFQTADLGAVGDFRKILSWSGTGKK